MNRKRVKKWLVITAIVYVAVGTAFYFLQDRILFHPVSLKREQRYDFSAPHKELNIAINNEDTLHLVQFLSTNPVIKGVVLYFHGNKKNIGWYAKYPPHFTRHGYEVLMIDYPGFGKSTGHFTGRTLYNWAKQVYKLARTRFGADSIIIYGKSMGTGIATHLASLNDCKRLILETPYYDFPSVVKQYLPVYPVHWLLKYQFPTYRYLPNVKAPVTIFHGTADRVIRYKNAKRLEPLLNPADEFVTIEKGSHNNLYQFPPMIQKLDSLLKL